MSPSREHRDAIGRTLMVVVVVLFLTMAIGGQLLGDAVRTRWIHYWWTR